MLKRLNDYDWEEAFKYAVKSSSTPGDEWGSANRGGFTREDVAEIIAIEDGKNDGPDWLGVFKLRDGRFAALRAGCDYTGWD